MSVCRGTIKLQSKDHKPDFHNVTDTVRKIVAESGIKNGICVVYSHHTTCSSEGQYMHPGPKHIEFALSLPGEAAHGSLNTDAHLRSVFFGRSETVVLVDGELSLGQFRFIYFIDWDQVRERERVCEVQIVGE